MTLTMAAVVAMFYVLAGQAPAFKASPNPVSDTLREQASRASQNLIGSAELMPADRYGYHPTEPQMTFGQLMAHVAQTNVAICSGIASTPAPMTGEELMKLSGTLPKDALIGAVKRSFDFCSAALAKLSDAQLADEVTIFGRRTGQSRAAAMVTIAMDWADHYSTAASYLRQNNVLPPTARPK
jgi:hypothetical protein